MRPALLLSLVILACSLSGQDKPTRDVETLVNNYCGENPILSPKEVAEAITRMEKRFLA